MSPIVAIVNPRSGGGRTAARVDAIRRALEARFDDVAVWLTAGPGDGAALAARAAAEGAPLVAAFGGDGTVHEVVNGLLAGRDRSDVRLGVVHAGTGGDFVKTLGTPTDLDGAVQRLADGEDASCDVIHASFVGHDGQPRIERCVNVLGVGMSGEVVRRVNGSSKRWGGPLTFAVATVRTVLSYRPPEVVVRWDGPDGPGTWSGRLSSAFIANGAHCGGGMVVGRGVIDDGCMDLTIIPELPLVRSVRSLPRLYDGSLGSVKDVSTARVWEVAIDPITEGAVLLDLDGEQPGVLPARFSVLKKALFIRR